MSTNELAGYSTDIAGTDSKTGSKMSFQTLFVLVTTAFLSSMGLTIVYPVLPFIVGKYLNNPDNLATMVGWLTSIYAIGQFIAAPALGVLSDHFGRKPLLIICLTGTAVGYLLFGFGGALWVLFLGRILDGLTGGDFSILTAYIADVTKPEERGKLFGIFGATVGVGFIVGPVLGGFTAKLSIETPFFLSAGLTGLVILMALVYMPESLDKSRRATGINVIDLNPLKQLKNLLQLSGVRSILLLETLYRIPFTIMIANLSVLIIDSLQADPGTIGLVFLITGIIDIVVQGGLVGKLLPVFGEKRLLVAGFTLQIVSYMGLVALVFVPSIWLLWAEVAISAFSSGFIEPSLNSLLSRSVGDEKQGAVQGGNQAINSLITIAAPVAGGLLYTGIGHGAPYLLSALLMAISAVVVMLVVPGRKKAAAAPALNATN